MKKIWIFQSAILLFVVLVNLSGCNTASPVKSNSDIMNELSETKYYLETYPEFIIKDVDIVKRQTDVENKTDKVYVTLSVSNEDESISGYIDMEVLYGLYNDGWVLDNCEVDFDGANGGNYFKPTKGIDVPLEEVISSLTYLTGEEFNDVKVYAYELDLENGVEYYSITGNANHFFMTETIDATLTYSFLNSVGYWDGPSLATNYYKENWHIAGEYYCTDGGRDHIVIFDDSPVDSISIGYKDTLSDYESTAIGMQMYDIDLITKESLTSGALKTWNDPHQKYIDDYNFSVEIKGEYSSLTSFEYATYWNDVGNRCDGILYIGKDNIGFSETFDYDVDAYNRRILLYIWNLIPTS